MNKTCSVHKEFHTGCAACQHDCIEENLELKIQNEELKRNLELTLAKIWDNKYEEDKIFLIIDHAVHMMPKKLIEKYKKELGY